VAVAAALVLEQAALVQQDKEIMAAHLQPLEIHRVAVVALVLLVQMALAIMAVLVVLVLLHP
jgi:hypothetical protein